MQIVVYFRTHPVEPELSAAALTRQQEAVAAWLDENGATLIGTFTETETSTKSRPQLGAALKACREHNAALLLAMTNAIGASPPLTGVCGYLGGVRCHAIDHPEANPPAVTPTAPDVVVYYRSRPSEPEESERVMVAQHQGVSRWLSVHGGRVIDSFTEAEGTSLDRPALAASFRACKATGATLLVASRDAIGMGSLPTINIVSVPVAVAPTEFTPPATLPMPADTPARLSLYRRFGSSALLSVYLCNPGPGSLTRIVLRSSGVTTKIGPGVSVTAGAERQLDLVEPGCCRLIDTYNLYTDGDRLTPYALTFVDAEGIQRSAGLILGPDDPINAFHAFKLDPEPADPARGGRLR